MAQAKTLRFSQQLLMLGDGETAEQFTAPCGFESLNLTVNIETNSTNIPDCEDPDLPSWLVSDEVSKQMQLGGEGVIDTDGIQDWRDWLMDGGEKNVRWVTQGSAANGGGYWQAPALLTGYDEQGQRGQRWRLSIGLTLQGKPTWVDAAPGS